MKAKVLFLICVALFIFQSFSPWEGAASVAPSGELPASGFFVSTNSFPRNTVVDITNIENGKSTRVIVANTLNSPGLLAIVSNEAAQLIGMRSGSISRIRMVAPSDPIAYQRFTESLAQEIPSFDSGNVIRNEEELLAEVYREDTYQQPAVSASTQASTPASVSNQASSPAVTQAPVTEPLRNEFSGPSYVMEPEWGGTSRMEIVDVPRYNEEPIGPFETLASPVTPPVNIEEPVSIVEEPVIEEPVYIVEEPVIEEPISIVEEPVIEEPVSIVEEPLKEEPVKEEPVYITEEPWIITEPVYIAEEPVFKEPVKEEEVIKDVSIFLTEKHLEEIDKSVGTFIAENPQDEFVKDIPEFNPERERIEIVKEVEDWEVPSDAPPVYNLVQAEEKAPEQELYGIDPNDIIPGIVPPAVVEVKVEIPEVIAPVQNVPLGSFSLRTIPRLDRGQYYVQLAALPEENVENAINQFGHQFHSYDPVVYRENDNLYRILIGPLNQGESAAVLARFKSIGYRDAFVRRGS
ncbi:MAG: SPOR domain-containing protein [Treponema sp.]|nr:SPOR domain-containing protein [Treponema sp.]MCL2250361.1 SPOR domain-containing protein [Treponema sp.]